MENIYDTYSEIRADIRSEIDLAMDQNGSLPNQPKCFMFQHGEIFSDNTNTYATLLSCAILSNRNQQLLYELKWDCDEAKPFGDHLGQSTITTYPMQFVEDKSSDGQAITDKQGQYAPNVFFDARTAGDQCIFYFRDRIEQFNTLSGRWMFRLSVRDATRVLVIQRMIIDWDQQRFTPCHDNNFPAPSNCLLF